MSFVARYHGRRRRPGGWRLTEPSGPVICSRCRKPGSAFPVWRRLVSAAAGRRLWRLSGADRRAGWRWRRHGVGPGRAGRGGGLGGDARGVAGLCLGQRARRGHRSGAGAVRGAPPAGKLAVDPAAVATLFADHSGARGRAFRPAGTLFGEDLRQTLAGKSPTSLRES